MIGLGDILRVVTTSSLGDIVSKNVYHVYVESTETAFSGDESYFARMFHLQVAKELNELTVAYQALISTKVTNLSYMDYPFGEYAETIAGEQSGDNAPTFVAFSFRQLVSSNKTRGGYKRYMGVSETFMAGNNFTEIFVTAANLKAPLLGGGTQQLYEIGGDEDLFCTYRNIILKTAHEAIPSSADWQYVTGVQFINSPTSQNTRKRL